MYILINTLYFLWHVSIVTAVPIYEEGAYIILCVTKRRVGRDINQIYDRRFNAVKHTDFIRRVIREPIAAAPRTEYILKLGISRLFPSGL